MKIVEKIKEIRKDMEVVSLGENDILVYYERPGKKNHALSFLKMVFICLTVFFGTGISIMAYNNDVGINIIFSDIYYQTMGVRTYEPTILHLSYAAGVFAGMIVFFNHISKKRITDEPTPVEVQMRVYEKNVNEAVITGESREGKEQDVDS